ncbi:MAG: hypothetical protein LBL07_11720 [Tannerella sp.]|jgi:hypothetical protein|nr:hypothetical protein [Tannerella sp.]
MNKKILFSIIAAVMIGSVAIFNVNVTKNEVQTDVTLANVEALAQEAIYFICTGIPVPLVCFWLNGQAMAAGEIIYL